MNDQARTWGSILGRLSGANWTRWTVAIVAIVVAFYVGRSSADRIESTSPAASTKGATAEKATIWTCSMHPQIQLPGPGKCPICGMDLIPLEDSSDDAGPRALSMSEADRALAEIQTTKVVRRFVETEIRMVGKVTYDETRVKSVSAWVPGRLDRLFVDYTGTAVAEGDHMVLLYSPKLLEAQGSLIEAAKSLAETANETSQFLRDSARRHLESEREKLRLWGLTDDQVAAIEQRGTVEPHIQINSPLSGIVIHKKAVEGMYVETGTPIYTVADLSEIWLELDAYEMDFPWVRYGQPVKFTTEAHPGETFEGWISFIPPYLDEMTRTKKVRVNVRNVDLRLKPGMFVRAIVRSKLASGGRVIAPDLASKFICPMHHEIVKDEAGTCDVCGMALVSARSLGFVTAERPEEAPLVVPTTAVLMTGRRGVVYVAVPNRERPTYEGREVVVGPKAGDWYIIRDGLNEGEIVVTNGNFKIDSALQILAKPSMMSISGEREMKAFESSPDLLSALTPLYDAYLRAHVALSKDDFESGHTALGDLGRAASGIGDGLVEGEARDHWASLRARIGRATEHAGHSKDIDGVRGLFKSASEAMIDLEKSFGHGGLVAHREAFCPMADGGKGAAWLQTAEEVENPYFGSMMFHCGEVRAEHAPRGEDRRTPATPEGAERSPSSAADFRESLRTVYERYFALHRALAGDDLAKARESLEALGRAAKEVASNPSDEADRWATIRAILIEQASHVEHATEISAVRSLFREVANRMIELEESFGHVGDTLHRVAFCPMANGGEGGAWLQTAEQVENPFYGASMFRCGEIRATHSAGEGR